MGYVSMRSTRVLALAVGLGAMLLCAQAEAGYVLSFVAKSGDVIGGKTLSQFAGDIDLNASGAVAFQASYAGGTGAFTQNSFIAGTGSIIGGKTLVGVDTRGVQMNDSGIVAFLGDLGGTADGVFTQNELIVEEGGAIGALDVNAISTRPDINNAGTVTFTGIDTSPFTSAIFTKTQVIVKTGDVISRGLQNFTMQNFTAPSIDSAGNITFATNIANGVFSHDGTSGTVIKVPGDSYGAGLTLQSANQQVSALNASGTVAFPALVTGSPGRRMVTESAIIATAGDLVDGGTITINSISTSEIPDVNDAGTVVYRANTNLGSGFIFAGQDKILGLGTIVDGIPINSGTTFAINNAGQIAVRVSYTGGSGIVLATPDFLIPAPSALAMTGLAVIGGLSRRGRR